MTVWKGEETLIALIHGESGVGKTPVGHTTPAPRLILDSENGSRFVRSGRRAKWDPNSEAPPAAGAWETCIVQCRDYATFRNAMSWLHSGKHPFRSVTIDSLTELQKRCKDTLVSADAVADERTWGKLLTSMEKDVRDLRDLTMHQTTPLQAVVILALTDDKKGKFRPFVQGSLSMSLPGLVDVIGYQYVDTDESGQPVRRMLVQPMGPYVAKDRTAELPSGGLSGIHGPVLTGPFDISALIDQIYTDTDAA